MPYGSLVKTSTGDDAEEEENLIADALRRDNDVVMANVNSNIQSDVAEKEEPVKKGGGSKKNKDRKVEGEKEVEIDDTEGKEKRKEKEEKKSSGKKRKGEEDTPAKRRKKAKTASA